MGRIFLEHAYTHTRERRGKRRDVRHGRDARHEKSGTRVTGGGKIIKKSTKKARKKHGGQLLKNY